MESHSSATFPSRCSYSSSATLRAWNANPSTGRSELRFYALALRWIQVECSHYRRLFCPDSNWNTTSRQSGTTNVVGLFENKIPFVFQTATRFWPPFMSGSFQILRTSPQRAPFRGRAPGHICARPLRDDCGRRISLSQPLTAAMI